MLRPMKRHAAIAVTIAAVAAVAQACAQGGGSGPDRAGGSDGGISRSDSGAGPRDGAPEDARGDAVLIGDRDSGRGDGTCTTATDCDDGLECNGVERCVAGRCEAGTAIACDDGVPCTRDLCDEARGAVCTFSPDDAMCGGGMSCDPVRGCVSGCVESPCRLVSPQCGCPSGQGCYLDGSLARVCATAGAAAEGATCTGITSCAPGLLCTDISATTTPTNVCLRFCATDSDCPGAGSLCVIDLRDGSGGTVSGARLCTRSCDPVAQTGCVSGAACSIGQEPSGAMRLLTHCFAPTGSGSQGASCVDDGDCRAGFACIDPDGGGFLRSECMHWCNVATGAGCSGGTVCYGFVTPLLIGSTEYGVCDI